MIAVRRAAAALDDDGMTRDEFIRFVAAELGRERVSAKLKDELDTAAVIITLAIMLKG